MKYFYPRTSAKYWLALLVFPLLMLEMQARHIVGGEVTYECIAQPTPTSRTYRIIVQLYRDALGGGAQFDSAPGGSGTFELTIFEGRGIFNTYEILASDLVIEEVDIVDPDPCVVYPPAIRTQRGTYTTEITLPISTEIYTISYQRCCRNEVINNLVNPGDAGATYTIEITPEAQQICNSSPTFVNFAPIVICNDRELTFDHSAIDADGDQLVYSLCDPYYGGGPNTGSGANSINGVIPNPESAPPYDPVVFSVPYTNLEPIDSEPDMSINPTTGELLVFPQSEGVFVVCLSVSEYRNGVLLSTVRRDFQFNIVNCSPLVQANFVTDATLDSLDFGIVQYCGSNDIQLINASTDREFIQEIRWEIPGTINGVIVSDQDVVNTTFPDYGTYPAMLIANPGLVCNDTLNFFIRTTPPSQPDFEFAYDTCVYGPVEFTDLSTTESDSIVFTRWAFGNGDTSFDPDPAYTYPQAGRRNIQLEVRDNFNCSYTEEKEISYFPVPAQLNVDISGDRTCAPNKATFRQTSDLFTEEYEIFWDFGNGVTSTEINPDYQYEVPGEYLIYVSATSPFGCLVDTQLQQPLRILESPISDFVYSPEVVDIRDPSIDFFDRSYAPVSWEWYFDSLDISREQNDRYVFPDTGAYEITLIVSHINGCLDTSKQQLRVRPFSSYFLPNAFTPDGDGVNESFVGVGYTQLINSFNMKIFNRWGELVFESDDVTQGWDGRNERNGGDAQEGVYLFTVDYIDDEGAQHSEGFLTLLR